MPRVKPVKITPRDEESLRIIGAEMRSLYRIKMLSRMIVISLLSGGSLTKQSMVEHNLAMQELVSLLEIEIQNEEPSLIIRPGEGN